MWTKITDTEPPLGEEVLLFDQKKKGDFIFLGTRIYEHPGSFYEWEIDDWPGGHPTHYMKIPAPPVRA